MTRTELIISLIRYRFVKTGIRSGMSHGEAELVAETMIKNQGLYGFFGKMKALGTPEGAIAVIVESILKSVTKRSSVPQGFAETAPASGVDRDWIESLMRSAIQETESFRAGKYGGVADYPHELKEFVYYRMSIEIRSIHKLDPVQIGMDYDITSHMVDRCLEYYGSRL